MIRLKQVVGSLPRDFAELQAEARDDGYRMLDTLADEWARSTVRFDRPGEVLFSAYVDDALVGIGGLTLEPAIPGALRMRRFYVSVPHRRSGVGRALAITLLGPAHGRTLTANAAKGSEAFWESLGFVADRREDRTHIRRCG